MSFNKTVLCIYNYESTELLYKKQKIDTSKKLVDP